MEQNPPWEANSRSANQEIPRLVWDPEVYFRPQTNPHLDSVLSQVLYTLDQCNLFVIMYSPQKAPFNFS